MPVQEQIGESARSSVDSANRSFELPSANRPRIFILSDVRLHREGVAMILSRIDTIEIVGTGAASDGVPRIGDLSPDIVLLDTSLVDSLALPKRVREITPNVKIVAFAVSGVAQDVIACVEAGISAYVGRDGSADDLVAAIHQAMRGEFACSPRITALLFSHLATRSAERTPFMAAGVLTHREREIVPLIEQGLSNKEIARCLRLEATTVKNHIHNILEKLKVRRRGEVAARMRDGRSSLSLSDAG